VLGAGLISYRRGGIREKKRVQEGRLASNMLIYSTGRGAIGVLRVGEAKLDCGRGE